MPDNAPDWIIAIAAFLGVGVSIYNAFKTRHLERSTNSKMDLLLALTASASKAEGVKEEKERQTKP
jgi:hypothetical protein